MRPRRLVALGAALVVLTALAAPVARAATPATGIHPGDWPTYGGSAHHTFSNTTGLNTTNVHTLVPKWFFKTGDAVTANPVVVGNRVYVGSWDGNFYAIERKTGHQRWRFQSGGTIWFSAAMELGRVFFGSAGREFRKN